MNVGDLKKLIEVLYNPVCMKESQMTLQGYSPISAETAIDAVMGQLPLSEKIGFFNDLAELLSKTSRYTPLYLEALEIRDRPETSPKAKRFIQAILDFAILDFAQESSPETGS